MRTCFPTLILSLVLPCGAAVSAAAQTVATPRIIFVPSPAVLIEIDGDPVYREVDGTGLERVVNTKPLILRDGMGIYYLRILDGWMEAYSLDESWSVAGVPPEGADLALKQAAAAKDVDLLDGASTRFDADNRLLQGRLPLVIVSNTPAVLIVTDGAPKYAPVPGTALTYMENTDAKVFREPTDQQLYLLLSGRWFRSWTTEGPWQFIPSNQLPADFAKIPQNLLNSNVEEVRSEVEYLQLDGELILFGEPSRRNPRVSPFDVDVVTGPPIIRTNRRPRLVARRRARQVSMRELDDRRQLGGLDQITRFDQDVVLFRQRPERFTAVEPVVVELPGDRAGTQRIVQEGVGVVRVIVTLCVECST